MLYDTIIIGSGPAGYSASIYCSRYKLKNLIIGKEPGGQIAEAHIVENYPGFPSIAGNELMKKFKEHAEKFNQNIIQIGVREIIKENNGTFTVIDDNEQKYYGKTIILATGTTYRKLQIPGEEDFVGKGVSFCFTCDGPFFKNKTVAVVGGGDSAAMASIYLSEIAKEVYLIFRKDKLTAEPIKQEKIKQNAKIKLVPLTNIKEIKGEQIVKEIKLDNPYKGKKILPIDGVFIEIGSVPSLVLAKKLKIKTDKQGYIEVKADQSTNIKGVFAAGDITNASNKFRQVVVAASEGAISASSAYKFLNK